MEEDLRSDDSILKTIVEKRLEQVVDKAQERIDKEAAANPELRFALEIVERFLKKKKRVCYGGTAMNAQLPKELQFYSEEKDLPDYDFFTPSIEEDTEEIVNDLKKAGFEEVANRVGMHDGTKKILVNYVAVADISEMESDVYEMIVERSVTIKGIHYTDPDILRMMMYLELSRPKGEVSRWVKVYERLQLMNKAFPMKKCVKEERKPKEIPLELRKQIHEFCIENKKILAGARLEKVYFKSMESSTPMSWETREGGAVVFYSQDPKKDALILRQRLRLPQLDIRYFPAMGEVVPARLEMSVGKKPFALLIQETACHSFNTMKDEKGRTVLIASLDTLISLYLSLAIFTKDEKYIFGFSLMCAAERFIDVNTQLQRSKRIGQFPPFPLFCRGYQKGYPTLLREKVERIAKEKASAKIKHLLDKQETRRVKKRKNKTHKK